MSIDIGPEVTPRRNLEATWLQDGGGPRNYVSPPRTISAIASDLDRVAADIDYLYRTGQLDDAIPLHDALHAVHRAIFAVYEADAVTEEYSCPELWIA